MEEKVKIKELKRMRYFDGLFLDKDDYKLDQDYQRRLLQLHNRYMHTNGIVAGLEIIPLIATKGKLIDKSDNEYILTPVCKIETEEGCKYYSLPKEFETDSERCKVNISEGMALNLLSAEENEDYYESTSQQIFICKDHPDSNIDLSLAKYKYPTNKDIYIYVSYLEENQDQELIKGQYQDIHTWERAHIGHSTEKPKNPNKEIILGTVMLGIAKKTIEKTTGIAYFLDDDGELKNKPIGNSVPPPPKITNEFIVLEQTIVEQTNKSFNEQTGISTLEFNVSSVTAEKNEETKKAEIYETEETKTKTETKEKEAEKQVIIESHYKKINNKKNDLILCAKDETNIKTYNKETGEYVKTTNSSEIYGEIETEEGITTKKKDESITKTLDKVTEESEIKIKGTTTVVNEIENKDEKTGTVIETKKTIETIVDNTITEHTNEPTNIPEIKTNGTTTVTKTLEINNKNTGDIEETNEIIETNIDYTTIETTDETGQIKKITKGKNNVITKVYYKKGTEDQRETVNNNQVIDIHIEETTITDDNSTQTTIVTKETNETTNTTKTVTAVKTIVRKVDDEIGVATITTTIRTTGEETDREGKIILIEPTIETIVEKEATTPYKCDVTHTITFEPLKYVKSVSCFDSTKDSIRKYSGPGGNELTVGKMLFKLNNQTSGMPFIRAYEEDQKIGLEVDSPNTNFKGSVNVTGDLIIKGKLIDTSESSDEDGSEASVANSFVQVNGKTGSDWVPRDGGLQIYRGETEESSDACLMWSEKRKRWMVGYKYSDSEGNTIDKDFYDIAYGDKWEKLINRSIVDDLHKHSKLYSNVDNVALEVNNSGELLFNGNLSLSDKTVWLRSDVNKNHGIGWFGTGKTFANIAVDGPVLFGLNGGILGTTENGQKAVITWNSTGNVGIGVKNPIDDKLELGGTLRILSDTNPIRFTPNWTGIKNEYANSAEISNDTSNYKALVIVGNNSGAKKGEIVRKVAIWDRLDVNGYLYVDGDMQVANAIKPSSGVGNNGIIFPKDPGGGSGDSAWLKYYANIGEACNLEIGTSNDANDNIVLMASGNVGIGTKTPADKLDVNGNMRVLSGTNPIRFTSVWDGSSSLISNQAEICNDVTRYKSLILVGNKSSGKRKVSVWDNLDVNGSLTLNGDLKTLCAIVPSVGNGINNGISFPREYNGDKGDAAWIRYYSDAMRGGRENMSLEIGIGDDAGNGRYNGGGDRIRLYASGGVYVDGYFYYSSSRELKENITALSTQKAKSILNGLNPVSFNFKGDTQKTTLGFISEEVPKEVAAVDQKAISPMEIVAVLTSVVKEQRKVISELKEQVEALSYQM